MMLSRAFAPLAFALATVGFHSTFAADLSGDDIVKKADRARMPIEQLGFTATVKDYKGKEALRETRYEVLNKNAEVSLVKTVFPENQQGRKLLMDKENLWLSTPDIKRAARVSMQQKLTGEIANGDLARTNFSNDYSAKILGTEKYKDKDAYHLELNARRPEVTYSKIEYWVMKEGFIPAKAIYYAVSGKALKSAEFGSVQTVLGVKCVTKMLVKDALDEKKQSILIYSDHKKIDVPGSVFTKESLGG